MTSSPDFATPGPITWLKARRRIVPAFGATGLFSAAVNLLMLTGSIYMLQIYDRVLSSGSVPTLLSLFAIVVVLYGFLGLFDALRGRLLSRAAHRFDADLGPGAGALWVGGSRTKDGTNVLSDLEMVRNFIASPALRGLFDLPFMPLFLGVLFIIHPWLGWLTLAGAGLNGLLAIIGRLATQGRLARGHRTMSAARSFADGARNAAETTAPMGMQPGLVARWRDMQSRALAETQGGADRADAIAAFSKAFRMLLQSAILTLGAWLVIGGEISAGAIVASSILSGRALAPIDQAIGQWKAIAGARDAWTRLRTAFADAPATAARVTELPAPTGHIKVSRMTKLAPGHRDWRLLTQIDFSLEPGDALGIIGNSASGKSSLARCLVGAWTPDMGEIRLDGATLDQWDPAALGRYIGYLPQNVTLLPGTIRDNIARMDLKATDAAVIEAAKGAGIHEMILALPKGYDTEVGPSAPPLSGGQMQRIGLARALYGAPRIVVLDEPNANLDAEGDAALARAIMSLREAGSTVVVIAHRPSALAAVNKVMVMQDGMIVRFGEKDEVLAATTQSHGSAPAQAGAGLRAVPRRTGRAAGAPSRVTPAGDRRQVASANTPARTVAIPTERVAPAGAPHPGPLVLRAPATQDDKDVVSQENAESSDLVGRSVLSQRATQLRHAQTKAAS